MGATALFIGFFSAIGWWGGNKVTGAVDSAFVPEAKCEAISDSGRSTMYIYMAQVDNVVDGDTLDASVDLGFKVHTKQRLRLARVDTPERNQPGYAMAKDFVTETVQGKLVKVETEKVSKFGYYLAEITLEDGSNLSDLLISKGLGVPYSGGKK